MSGLDPIGRRDFRDLILEERGRGTTVFFSSHILQDAEMICDRVGIVVRGRLRTVGRLEDLLAGGRRGYEVALSGVGEGFVPDPATVIARSASSLLLRTPSLEDAEAVARAARAAGGRLVSLVPARATLEDVFLEELRAGEGAAGA
jgi:ABC-2 type transport system ATP-binding protein